MLVAKPILSKTTIWNPTWTNITMGSSVSWGQYTRLGRWIEFTALLNLAAGFSMASQPGLTLPFEAAFVPSAASFEATAVDQGTMVYELGFTNPSTTSAGRLVCWTANATNAVEAAVSNTVPFSWGNTDAVQVIGHYLAKDAV